MLFIIVTFMLFFATGVAGYIFFTKKPLKVEIPP